MNLCEEYGKRRRQRTGIGKFCVILPWTKEKRNRSAETRQTQKMKIMEQNTKNIRTITYRMERYQSVGNGSMCQTLNRELHLLQQKTDAAR